MVINDRRKAIFIHIPKTGGISVERSIHKALGGDEKIKYGQLINQPPKIEQNIPALGLHSALRDYRRYFGQEINDFYIFSIVRNPWRRMVSHYEYLVTTMFNRRVDTYNQLDFPKFVQVYKTRLLAYSLPYGYDTFLKDDYGTQLNKVIKLENINEDLPIVGDEIKLEITEVLHMNPTNPKQKEHSNWKDYYNPGLRDRVYKMFENDIKKYNYEFDE
jgi:hypothetical protein